MENRLATIGMIGRDKIAYDFFNDFPLIQQSQNNHYHPNF